MIPLIVQICFLCRDASGDAITGVIFLYIRRTVKGNFCNICPQSSSRRGKLLPYGEMNGSSRMIQALVIPFCFLLEALLDYVRSS